MVSIIMPAYTAAPWIGEAVASALVQEGTALEVVVVDDGSTDETAEVVAGIDDPRVRLIRQENRGAAGARNAGWRAARGTHLQFLDADDLLGPGKLKRQLEALAAAPARAVASCAWARFTGDPGAAAAKPEPVWTEPDPLQWIIRSLSGEGMMQTGAWLVPRALAEAAGPWNEALSLHDDGEFFARVLLQASRQVFVPGPRVCYRQVPTSLSRDRSRRALESALAVCEAHDRLLRGAAGASHAARRAAATSYAQFAYELGAGAPDLRARALAQLAALGVAPHATVGGWLFRMLVRGCGFPRALRLRQRLLRGKDVLAPRS